MCAEVVHIGHNLISACPFSASLQSKQVNYSCLHRKFPSYPSLPTPVIGDHQGNTCDSCELHGQQTGQAVVSAMRTDFTKWLSIRGSGSAPLSSCQLSNFMAHQTQKGNFIHLLEHMYLSTVIGVDMLCAQQEKMKTSSLMSTNGWLTPRQPVANRGRAGTTWIRVECIDT